MTKRTVFQLTLILSAFVLMACTCSQHHIYYTPPVQNVPLLSEKNEINAEVGFAGGELPNNDQTCGNAYANGFLFQGAYSPKQNVGLALNFMHVSLSRSYYENSNGNIIDVGGSGKGFSFDASAGYYNTLDKLFRSERSAKITHSIIFETYGGFGYSGQEHSYRDSIFSGNADLHSLIFFVQPAIGINLRWITLALSARINNFYFYSINTAYPDNYPGSAYATQELNFIEYLRAHRLQSFIEPAFTIRGGWKYLKLSFQYCTSMVLNTGQPSNAYETEKISLGLSINIAPRYKKKRGSEGITDISIFDKMFNETELKNIFSWKPYRPDWRPQFGSLVKDFTDNTSFDCYFSENGGLSNYLEFYCYPKGKETYEGNAILVCISVCAPIASYGPSTIHIRPKSLGTGGLYLPEDIGNIPEPELKTIEEEITRILSQHMLSILDRQFASLYLPEELMIKMLGENHNGNLYYLHGFFNKTD